jgi:tRNA wybutosine-synthesizing protein 1
MSDENLQEYANLIKKAQPDFIHVKGFMSIGYARKRIPYNKQPWHHEIKEFAKKLEKELRKRGMNYKILAEEERSCVVVLGKNKKMMRIKKP